MTERPQDPVRAARDEFADDTPLSDKPTPGEQPGDVIDRYKLLQEIGEGGMGMVWMAEQKEPVRRQVALKIIKLGMDTKEVVVRFEAERQALALMDHPNIARVLDGGATANGRPYFVMELVRGVPITQFCDEARLGLRDRLELFAKVCDAVQHAHHKGVIHRDLKPTNIMVTLHDGTPMPKVIDFGIAKATNVELTQKTMFTQYGNMIGTPEYMAPEQAEMSALDVDTRADIYSLGVLLYELLTGTKPFDLAQVLERGYQDLLRTIREDEPARPSTRVSTLGERAATVARDRHVNVASLSGRLKGEIDWIVMKALEKDRQRRYETANGFAADVKRYLAGEPVIAAPPSRTYRLRKFLARRRRTVLTAAALLVLFVAGAVGTGLGWWDAHLANEKLVAANGELEQANREKSLALENEKAARRATEEAKARVAEKSRRFGSIIRFHEQQLARMSPQTYGDELRNILESQVAPEKREALRSALADLNFTDVGITAIERTVIDPTLAAIDAWTLDDPTAKARLLNGTCVSLNAVGRHDRSLQISRKAMRLLEQVGAANSDLGITVKSALAVLLCQTGNPHEAEPFARATLASSQRDGADPVVIAQAHYALGMALTRRLQYEDAVEHYRASLDILSQKIDGSHDMVMWSRSGLVNALLQSANLEEAEVEARRSLAISRKHFPEHYSRVVIERMGLLEILRRRKKLKDAEPLFEGLMADARRAFGEASQETTDAALIRSFALVETNRFEEAEEVLQAELQTFASGRGSRADRERLKSALIGLESKRGDYRAAELASAKALREARRRGDTGMELIGRLVQHGSSLQMRGELDEAEALFEEALQHLDKLGRIDMIQIAIRARLAATWRSQGKLDEAVAALRELLVDSKKVLGPNNAHTLQIMNSLAVSLQGQGKYEETLPLFEQIVASYRETLGERHPSTLFARGNYGTGLQTLGRNEEALKVFRDVNDQQVIELGEAHPQTLLGRLNVGGALGALERHEEAREILYGVLAPLEKALGAKHHDFVYALQVAGTTGFRAGDLEGGEQRLRRALAIAREHYPQQVPNVLYALASDLLEYGKPNQAEPLWVELLALREEVYKGDFRAPNTRLRLAASRGMQNKFADFATELNQQLEALKVAPHGDATPTTVAKAVYSAHEVVLRYYEAWSQVAPSPEIDEALQRLRGVLATKPR